MRLGFGCATLHFEPVDNHPHCHLQPIDSGWGNIAQPKLLQRTPSQIASLSVLPVFWRATPAPGGAREVHLVVAAVGGGGGGGVFGRCSPIFISTVEPARCVCVLFACRTRLCRFCFAHFHSLSIVVFPSSLPDSSPNRSRCVCVFTLQRCCCWWVQSIYHLCVDCGISQLPNRSCTRGFDCFLILFCTAVGNRKSCLTKK